METTEKCRKGEHDFVLRVMGEVVQSYNFQETNEKHRMLAGEMNEKTGTKTGANKNRHNIYKCCKNCVHAEPAYPQEGTHERAKRIRQNE